MFILTRYLKGILAQYRRLLWFVLSMTLLCILAGSLGRSLLYARGIGEVMAVFVIPKNFAADVMYGRNPPYQVYLSGATNALSSYEYYFYAVFFLVILLLGILMVDVIETHPAQTIHRLEHLGVSGVRYLLGLLAALTLGIFLVSSALLSAVYCGMRFSPLPFTLSARMFVACFVMAVYTALLAILLRFLIRGQTMCCVALSVCAFASFLLGGGIVPVTFFPLTLRNIARLNVNASLLQGLGGQLTVSGTLGCLVHLLALWLLCVYVIRRAARARS